MPKEPILHPCKKCGTMCSRMHIYCAHCGMLQRKSAPTRKCPKCGKGTHSPDRKFCVHCGTAYE